MNRGPAPAGLAAAAAAGGAAAAPAAPTPPVFFITFLTALWDYLLSARRIVLSSVEMRTSCDYSQADTMKNAKWAGVPQLKNDHCRLRRSLMIGCGAGESHDHHWAGSDDFRKQASLLIAKRMLSGDNRFEIGCIYADGRNLRGGLSTALPARLAQIALNHRNTIKSFVLALFDGALPIVAENVLPVFHALGPDDHTNLVPFYEHFGQNFILLVTFMTFFYTLVYFVLDGATYASLSRCGALACPACLLSGADLTFAPFRWLRPDFRFDGPVLWQGGAPWIDLRRLPRFIFPRSWPIGPLRILWDWTHCAAHVLTDFLEAAVDVLDLIAGGVSPVLVAAVRRPLPRYRARATLSWGETKVLADAIRTGPSARRGSWAPSGIALIDEWLEDFSRCLSSLRSPSEDSMVSLHIFSFYAARLRHTLVSFLVRLNRPLRPASHYFFDHFHAAWRASGVPRFPRLVSGELGEKGHNKGQEDWRRSLMTTPNKDTGETGHMEVVGCPSLRTLFNVFGPVRDMPAPV